MGPKTDKKSILKLKYDWVVKNFETLIYIHESLSHRTYKE